MVLVIMLLFFIVSVVSRTQAQSITSTSFEIENPTFMLEGGQSSSPSFQYLSNTGEFSIGELQSTNFATNLGFLYFPIATSPVVSTTPGTGQVTLSWTPATSTFGNITTYEVGVSTNSAGPYTFTSLGNVLTFTQTGLPASVIQYFKVRSYASGVLLSESVVVSATPLASSPPPSGGGGGGGGSDPITTGTGGVVFSGKAYPNRTVVLLKDAQVVTSTVAGANAQFTISLTGISGGNYTFSVYSEDSNGNRSSLLTFPVSVTTGITSNISGIFITPTIDIDKSAVKQGDNLVIFGQSVPSAEVTISVHSNQEIFNKVNTDTSGAYLFNFDTSVLETGNHVTKSKTAKEGQISGFGNVVGFVVGNESIPKVKNKKCPVKADLNNDCKVNLVDFSIAAFWYKRTLNQATITLDQEKLKGDNKIDLTDFSILAYHWTG